MKKKLYYQIALFAAFMASLAIAMRSQTPTPTPKISEEDAVIKVDSRLIVVPVSVTDASGQPVLGLTTADFRIAEEGKAQTIAQVSDAEKVPLEIALLFDVSASTDAMFRFEQETAAKFLKDVLRPEDRATIYSVGQKPVLIQERDSAERSIASVMTIQPAKGATAFFDTVGVAASYLRKNSPEGRRKVVVVISDGEDNFSEGVQRAERYAERKLVDDGPDRDYKRFGKIVSIAQQRAKTEERGKVSKALQDADMVFYSINPAGSSYQLNQISIFGQENMKVFADQTGGSAYLPKFLPVDTKDTLQNSANMKKNQATLEQIFRQLANELRAQYLIQYYSDAEFPTNKYVKLDVGLQNRPALKIRAREGYYVKN